MIDKLPSYLKFGVPGLVANFLAMFPFEILPIYAGWIGESEIASNVILNNMYFIIFHIPYSVSISSTVMVGNNLGANLPKKARSFFIASYELIILIAI